MSISLPRLTTGRVRLYQIILDTNAIFDGFRSIQIVVFNQSLAMSLFIVQRNVEEIVQYLKVPGGQEFLVNSSVSRPFRFPQSPPTFPGTTIVPLFPSIVTPVEIEYPMS